MFPFRPISGIRTSNFGYQTPAASCSFKKELFKCNLTFQNTFKKHTKLNFLSNGNARCIFNIWWFWLGIFIFDIVNNFCRIGTSLAKFTQPFQTEHTTYVKQIIYALYNVYKHKQNILSLCTEQKCVQQYFQILFGIYIKYILIIN